MIDKKRKYIIIITLVAIILIIAGLTGYGLKTKEYEETKTQEMERLNPGGTGGDYFPRGGLSIIGRGYLTMTIGEYNTGTIEEGLKKYFIEQNLPYNEDGEYSVVIKKNSITSDLSEAWVYRVPIVVNDKNYFVLIIKDAPGEDDIEWSIEKSTTQ